MQCVSVQLIVWILVMSHWPVFSLPKMFPCCFNEMSMTRVFRVVCYAEVRRG